jgi:hypothetical protein
MADTLKIATEFDVGPITAGAKSASEAVSILATKFKEVGEAARVAGDASQATAARYLEQGSSATAAAASLEALGYSSKEAATAVAAVGSAAGVAAPQLERVAKAAVGAGVGFEQTAIAGAKAREILGAATDSVGGMEYAFARLASRMSGLIPIINDLFPAFLVVGFIELLVDMISKIGDAVDAFEGWDKAAQKAYEDSVKANQEQLVWITKLGIEQRNLNQIGLTGSEKSTVAVKDEIAAAKDYAKLLQEQTVTLRDLQTQRDGMSKDIEIFDPETHERLGVAMDQHVGGVRAGSKAWDELTAKMSEAQKAIDETAKKIQEIQLVDIPKDVATGVADAEKEREKRARQAVDLFLEQDKAATKYWRTVADGIEAAIKLEDEFATRSKEEQDAESTKRFIAGSEAQLKAAEETRKTNEEMALASIAEEEKTLASTKAIAAVKLDIAHVTGLARLNINQALDIQELEGLKKLEDDKLRIIIEGLEKQRNLLTGAASGSAGETAFLAGATPETRAKYQAFLNEEVKAVQDSANKIKSIDNQIALSQQQAALKVEEFWTKAFTGINQAFARVANELITSTTKVSTIFIKMGNTILASVANDILQMGLKWAEHFIIVDLLEKSSLAKSIATLVSGGATKAAIKLTTDEALIQMDAGLAAAGAFASVMTALPFPLNISAAPGIAGAAFAETEAVGQAQRGALVPENMAIFAHAKEMVLPESLSTGLQRIIAGGGVTNTSSKRQNIGVNINARNNNLSHDDIIRAVRMGIRRGELPSL